MLDKHDTNDWGSIVAGLLAVITILGGCLFFVYAHLQPRGQDSSQIANAGRDLSPLALEGRDVFNDYKCASCHANENLTLPLLMAGVVFAPKFPFALRELEPKALRLYLTSPVQVLDSSSQDIDSPTDAANQKISMLIDENALDEVLVHVPAYEQLATTYLDGTEVQAKMLAINNQDQFNKQELVQTSADIAGTLKIDALIAYLRETADLQHWAKPLAMTRPSSNQIVPESGELKTQSPD